MRETETPASAPRRFGALIAACVLGAVAGIWEGALSMLFGRATLGPDMATDTYPLDPAILPYAVLLDVALFLLIGLVVITLAWLVATALGALVRGERGEAQTTPAIVSAAMAAITVLFMSLSLLVKLRGRGAIESEPLRWTALALAISVAVLAGWVVMTLRGKPVLTLMKRRGLSAALLLLLLAGSWGWIVQSRPGARDEGPVDAPVAAGASRTPNILLVVLDTVRADRCSTYGFERETTPNLTKLAAEGTLFTRAVSPAIWTVPGHASLFTGLYPGTHRADRESPILDSSLSTLASELSASGYDTAAFAGNPWISRDNGLGRGFGHLTNPLTSQTIPERQRDQLLARYIVRRFRPRTVPIELSGKDLDERTLLWLDTRDGANRPFFLFVNFFDAHWRYQPPLDVARRFLPADVTDAEIRRLGVVPESAIQFGGVELTDRELDIISLLYEAEISVADAGLGVLVEGLRSRGLLESTVIAVTADHGEMLGEHGHRGHELTVSEPLLRVPLVIRYPKRFPPGSVQDALVQSHDLHPTLLQLAGVIPEGPEAPDVPEAPDAPEAPTRSLLPESLARASRQLAFTDESQPKTTLARLREFYPDVDFTVWDRELRAVTDGRYKLIVGSDGDRRLYDIVQDPGEMVDISASHPDIVVALEAAIDARRALEGTGRGEGEGVETLPEDMREQLRALGYIN